jgi:hypothetical protein
VKAHAEKHKLDADKIYAPPIARSVLAATEILDKQNLRCLVKDSRQAE